MKSERMSMVRVYLTESEHRATALLEFLHRQGVHGATLYRGIAGFGASGRIHRADWMDLAGDLPLVLEFVDSEMRVNEVLPALLKQTEPRHVLRFPVEVVLPDSI